MRRFMLMFSMLVAAAASTVVVALPAHAALGLRDTADPEPWMANNKVYASALSEDGNTLYIGGAFNSVREKPPGTTGQTFAVNKVAAIDVATGAPIRTWKPAVTSNDGQAPVVRALAVKDGKVYIGGKFTTVDGQPRRNLAAVDASTGAVDPSFAPSVGDSTSTVFALLPDTSKIYIGGQFANVNGTSRGNLAAVDASTGALDAAWRARANNLVRDLKFGPNNDGTIFAIGGFNSVSSGNSGNIARQSVARFDVATSAVHSWSVPPGQIQTDSGRNNNMTCWDATLTPTRLFLGCGLGPNYVAAFRLDNGNSGDRVWQWGIGGNPQALASSPDKSRLIVGGHFGINPIKQQVCGKPLGGLIALDPANGQVDCSSNWVPHLDQDHDPSYEGAWTILSTDNYVWVGGGFVGVSGQPRTNLARFTFDPNLKTVNAAPRVDLDGLQRGGLDATYFDNVGFTGSKLTRTDPTVDFNWGNGSPAPSIGSDTFSARWTGQVEAPVSGQYTFITNSDDGVRLFVDRSLIIDNWTDHGPTDNSGTATLEAGKRYDIQLDYYENGGGAVARLHWSYPLQLRQAIPDSRLFFSGNLNHSATFAAGGGPTSIVDANNLTVSDADDANIRSAKVTLSGNQDATSERLLADTTGTPIAADYDAQSGVLSLEGSAPKADYQQVLRTVSYNNSCVNPTSGDRQASVVVNDGSVASEVATSTINVQGDPSGGDCSGLSVQAPTYRLPAANSTVNASTVPVNVSWSAGGGTSVVSSYELQRSTNGGTYQDVSLGSDTTRTNLNVSLAPGSEYRFRVRAIDEDGNTSAWAGGNPFALDAHENESAGVLSYSGTWDEQSLATAFGGTTMHTSEAGAKATFTFSGSDVSWVAQKGPDRGKAEVWLDGAPVATIDLYAASAQPRRVIYNATSLDPSVEHTLEVRVLGTKRAASTGTRVDVDALVALRQLQ